MVYGLGQNTIIMEIFAVVNISQLKETVKIKNLKIQLQRTFTIANY